MHFQFFNEQHRLAFCSARDNLPKETSMHFELPARLSWNCRNQKGWSEAFESSEATTSDRRSGFGKRKPRASTGQRSTEKRVGANRWGEKTSRRKVRKAFETGKIWESFISGKPFVDDDNDERVVNQFCFLIHRRLVLWNHNWKTIVNNLWESRHDRNKTIYRTCLVLISIAF